MQAHYFLDLRDVYRFEHLPGILCTSRNMVSGYTPVCISKYTIIFQMMACHLFGTKAIIWTKAAILSIWPQGTYFIEILLKMRKFSFKEIHLKMSMK